MNKNNNNKTTWQYIQYKQILGATLTVEQGFSSFFFFLQLNQGTYTACVHTQLIYILDGRKNHISRRDYVK